MVACDSSQSAPANDRRTKKERDDDTRADRMTTAAKISAAGLAFVLITSIGWGLNWPVTKYVLAQWPPLSARGLTGVAGGLVLALYAVTRGISLRVPRDQWFRLCVSAAPERLALDGGDGLRAGVSARRAKQPSSPTPARCGPPCSRGRCSANG